MNTPKIEVFFTAEKATEFYLKHGGTGTIKQVIRATGAYGTDPQDDLAWLVEVCADTPAQELVEAQS